MGMAKDEKEKDAKKVSGGFVLYDPENLPYTKLCVCEIISELPELTPEDIARFKDK